MKQKKLILVKLIGIGNDESKRINNDDKCNNKDNDDDDSDNDSDNDSDWKNWMYWCDSEASE